MPVLHEELKSIINTFGFREDDEDKFLAKGKKRWTTWRGKSNLSKGIARRIIESFASLMNYANPNQINIRGSL